MQPKHQFLFTALSILLLLLFPVAPQAEGTDKVYAWADVSITSQGVPESVKIVDPPLPPELAGPIEKTISAWSFTPATEANRPVPRTTSVLLALRLVPTPDGQGRIEAEKVEEGPRVVRRSHDPCLKKLTRAAPTLIFTVTEEGRAIDIAGSDPESESERCAVRIIGDTVFKPETVNGLPVSSRVKRQIRLK